VKDFFFFRSTVLDYIPHVPGKTTFLNYCRMSYGDYKYLSEDFFPKLQARCLSDIGKLAQRLEDV
jgi:hypothetical protein